MSSQEQVVDAALIQREVAVLKKLKGSGRTIDLLDTFESSTEVSFSPPHIDHVFV